MSFLDSIYGRLREHAGPDGLVRIDVALIKKLLQMGIHGGVLNAALDSLVAKKLIVRVVDDQYRILIKPSPGSSSGLLKQSSPRTSQDADGEERRRSSGCAAYSRKPVVA